jgi:hypothetical protein
MKIKEVEWLDSSGFKGGDTWQDKEDVIRQAKEDGICRCWSLGYVVHEDERQITLTLSHNGEDGMVMDPLIIPRCAIVKERELGHV